MDINDAETSVVSLMPMDMMGDKIKNESEVKKKVKDLCFKKNLLRKIKNDNCRSRSTNAFSIKEEKKYEKDRAENDRNIKNVRPENERVVNKIRTERGRQFRLKK